MALVAASAQNIDRVVALYRACKRTGRTLVLDLYAAEVLAATGNPRIPQSDWPGVAVFVPYHQRVRIKRTGRFDLVERHCATLTGLRIVDRDGVVLAGGDEVGRSLAGVEEVADALRGHFRAVMRLRVSKHPPPPLYALSRGTGLRVFVAMPVLVDGRVAGAVYASRTPDNVLRLLYGERGKVGLALLAVLVDDGLGIAVRDRARVFEPFFTTRREGGGTGMGLSIVSALLHGRGGTIAVADVERGAAFVIQLPKSGPPGETDGE